MPPRGPDFIIIGAMKAGTTALWAHLSEHPAVFMSAMKETNYFTAEKNWSRGADWYASLFADAPGSALCGEASPSYTKAPAYPGVPARIAAAVPHVKLIYLLREPLARMRSMYLHNVLRGRETASIDRALLDKPKYLDSSRYGYQLSLYLDHFDRRQIHITRAEDLRDDSEAALDELLQFLALKRLDSFPHAIPAAHVTRGRRVSLQLGGRLRSVPAARRLLRLAPRPVRAAIRTSLTRGLDRPEHKLSAAAESELRDRMQPDLEDLHRLLGPSFTGWERDAEG
jgi:hypothetical protein